VIQEPNRLGVRRLGVTASKKIGGAVKRNRVKRITREVFRVYFRQFPDSTDVVCIAKKGSHDLKMQEAAREILGCLMAGHSGKKNFSPGF